MSSSTSFSFLLIFPIVRTIAADNSQCTRYPHIKITNIRGERPPSSFSAAGCWITMPARSTSSTPGGWEAGVFAALARTFRWRWPDTLPGQTLQLALETQCRRIWRVTPPAKTAARMPCPCPCQGGPARQRRQSQATLGCDVPAGVFGVGPRQMLSVCGRCVRI